jgi:hypothetical protein
MEWWECASCGVQGREVASPGARHAARERLKVSMIFLLLLLLSLSPPLCFRSMTKISGEIFF